MTFGMYSLWKGRLSFSERLARRARPYPRVHSYARVEAPSEWRTPLRCKGESKPIVALGKFDAMHLGHRALAIRAARWGHPWLISFHGMAEVMGWDLHRLPLVAELERVNVLDSWTERCGGRTPSMRYLPFAEIRGMSPREFVKILVHDFGIAGAVAGANYRFGYKASGDARQLIDLGKELDIRVDIVDLVEADETGQQVREALEVGDMESVKMLLGRDYVLSIDGASSEMTSQGRYPKSAYLNQPPKDGTYAVTIAAAACTAKFTPQGVVLVDDIGQGVSTDGLLRIAFV